jgi:apolipoprotein N-acyltransferase
MAFDLSPGPGPKVFTVQGKEVATAIATPVCFEATKPALCRKLVRAAGSSPVVLVNLTNDGWFGTFRPGHLQHLQVARWRCVELGVPMIRAANTGISAAIESTGRLAATGIDGVPGAWSQDGVLTATVIPARARTLYSRVGNVFGWGVLSITGALLIVSFIPRRAGAQPQ